MSGADTPTVEVPPSAASTRPGGLAPGALPAWIDRTLRVVRSARVVERAPVVVAVLAVVVSVGGYVRVARRLWFVGDDWDFLLARGASFHDLMRPHNEHWSAVPLVVLHTIEKSWAAVCPSADCT